MGIFSGSLRSSILEMDTGLTVILPYDRPAESMKVPAKVLYLLHGLGNGHQTWSVNTNIVRYAREAGIAVIMPEVQKSFYTDMAFGDAYFYYITQELPSLCKSMFCIATERENTYIAGVSMGGYGALKAALTFPEQYAVCGSFSGALDISYLLQYAEKNHTIKAKLTAIFGNQLTIAPDNNLYDLAKQVAPASLPRMFINCGCEDYLIESNRNYHKYLQTLGIEVTYQEAPGAHDWYFFDHSIQQFLRFIS